MTSPIQLALCIVINGLILADSFQTGATSLSTTTFLRPHRRLAAERDTPKPFLTPRQGALGSGPSAVKDNESAFDPIPDSQAEAGDDDTLEKVEQLGRGAAKVRAFARPAGIVVSGQVVALRWVDFFTPSPF